MACLGQVGRHAAAHIAKTDKGNFHAILSFYTPRPIGLKPACL
jgi:hypothetical protein